MPAMRTIPEGMITMKQAGELMGVSACSARRAIKSAGLHLEPLGPQFFGVLLADVEAWAPTRRKRGRPSKKPLGGG